MRNPNINIFVYAWLHFCNYWNRSFLYNRPQHHPDYQSTKLFNRCFLKTQISWPKVCQCYPHQLQKMIHPHQLQKMRKRTMKQLATPSIFFLGKKYIHLFRYHNENSSFKFFQSCFFGTFTTISKLVVTYSQCQLLTFDHVMDFSFSQFSPFFQNDLERNDTSLKP